MQDRPTAIELLEAAANFVDREIVPVTGGRVRFQARVAANVMRIVAREIDMEESHLQNEVGALADLLERPDPQPRGTVALRKAAMDLNRELSSRIEAGLADQGEFRNRALRVVRQVVEDKLRIANPRFLEGDLAARSIDAHR